MMIFINSIFCIDLEIIRFSEFNYELTTFVNFTSDDLIHNVFFFDFVSKSVNLYKTIYLANCKVFKSISFVDAPAIFIDDSVSKY